MDDLITEEEKVKQLREWWSQNWLALVGGLVLGLGGVLGWQGWQAHKQEQAVQASAVYDQLQSAVQADDLDSAATHQETLTAKYKGTPYAGLGALALAGAQARTEQFEAAEQHLAWATQYADDAALRDVARLRLARVRWALGKPDEAVATLTRKPPPDAYLAAYRELEGDIRHMQGKLDAARSAYEAALAAHAANPTGAGSSVQRKLDNLGLVQTASSEAPDTADDTATDDVVTDDAATDAGGAQ